MVWSYLSVKKRIVTDAISLKPNLNKLFSSFTIKFQIAPKVRFKISTCKTTQIKYELLKVNDLVTENFNSKGRAALTRSTLPNLRALQYYDKVRQLFEITSMRTLDVERRLLDGNFWKWILNFGIFQSDKIFLF